MSDHEVKNFPKKRVYKRRSATQEKSPPPSPPKGLPPEDLAAFRELAPKLSPKGQEVVALLIKVFNEKVELNTDQLLQLIGNYTGQEKSSPHRNQQNPNLSPLISMLPLLTSSLGNQGINPTVLASLVSMLAANRPPRD
ncbi:MAG TPA: hypothetical protein GXZ98_07580 [Firmicutes bacterium]|jgi:hypothetical protein|nr:hypothetical protein [Bacillota bacterium]